MTRGQVIDRRVIERHVGLGALRPIEGYSLQNSSLRPTKLILSFPQSIYTKTQIVLHTGTRRDA